ncbi:MAG TPA: hypothetical protein VGA61_15990 [Anaerolineae bacterium]
MYQPRTKRGSTFLWVLIAVAALYGALLVFRHTLTGVVRWDATIGVVLGLFICSRPVSNMLDLILFGRQLRPQFASQRAEIAWLVLNVVVLLIGLLVLTSGTTRFAAGRV